jgi:hypothetical protein
MSPDTLPQLLATLLRLPRLEAAQLRELIQHFPDPHAAAQEMVRRGWITREQFSSLFPDARQRPTPQGMMLVGFGDGESPPAADGDDWGLTLSDDEDRAGVPPGAERARPDADGEDWTLPLSDEEMRPEPETVEVVPVLSGAASRPQFGWDVPVPLVAGGNEARRRQSDTDRLPRRRLGWASKGLLMSTVFLGSLFAGLPFFRANSTVPPVARQDSREANAGDPAGAVDVPPVPQVVPVNDAKQRENLPNGTGRNARPAAPEEAEAPVTAEAPPRAKDVRPKPTASLYDRVRQVVLENRTEETERLGIGDFAYQDVPDDGSILVGMGVSYAPFFNHQIIKSVQPIYQRPDGTRYEGRICGTPTGVGERVVAREGYAVGGAAITGGLGIDGMQLTFMEIGADGLNPDRSYLSKWLGGHGGSGARTYVNDGRPIIGVAGMLSDNFHSPAFCMCLVTTQPGALADVLRERSTRPTTLQGKSPR